MPFNVFETYAKIKLDTSEYDSGIEKARSSLLGLKEVFAGTFLADVAKQGLNFAIDMGKQATELASDLAEVQNVIDVTFGDGASTINAWAKAAKNAFGMGELSAKKYSGTMGAMLKSMGFTNDEALDMSTSIVKLAGDMASFYNLDHETAFEKIRSGISGETEPLKQLGINMSVANLEAYALSQGIKTAYSAMTQAEQAALRYNYIMEATAGAQGDFARTASGYANQIRILEENVNTILSQFGQGIIDLISPAIAEANALLEQLTTETVEQQVAEIDKTEADELLEADLKKARADALIDTIDELSRKESLSEYETEVWKNALQELVATFPELAEHIDLANGSIKTSTDEIRKNTEEAWTNAREKAKINALNAKEQVRANALQAAADAELALAVSKAEYETYNRILGEEIAAQNEWWAKRNTLLYERTEQNAGNLYEAESYVDKAFPEYAKSKAPQVSLEAQKQVDEAIAKWEQAQEAYDNAMASYEEANKAYEDTASTMDNIILKHEQEEAATQAATEAQEAYTEALKDETEAFKTLSDAWDAVAEHREETYGKMRDSLRNGTNDLWGVVADMTEIDIKKSMETAQKNMLSNIDFYSQYSTNLKKAKNAGVDEGLLAELSQNITAENAGLLQYITGQASEGEIGELNAAWKSLETSKNSLATTMQEAVLSVDEGYQAMVDAANEATESFNQTEQARQNAIDTGAGVVEGLDAAIPGIAAKVAEINGIIAQIGSAPVSVDLSTIGAGAGTNSMTEAVSEGIRQGMTGVRIPLDVGAVARALTPTINKNIGDDATSRRYG